MKIKTLGHALMMLMACATLNGTVNAKSRTCVTVMISGDSTLKEKLVMWTAFCGGGTPGWHPLEVNGPIFLQAGPPFKIADKKTEKVLLNNDKLVNDLHLTCRDTSMGPTCIPSQ